VHRIVPAVILAVVILSSHACSSVHASTAGPEGARIDLYLPHQILRGDIMIITGRLSTAVGDYPIALAKIHFQYYRSEDSYLTREVSMISSNPGGLFEDRFNTTSLLRIGTWFVNVSFPSQYGYPSTSTVESFTIVVQPALSLYLSSHDAIPGQKVSFDGLLFACIPCIQDEVTVIFARPDNTSSSVSLKLSPMGGPYPGGYYNGSFSPDVPGLWHVRAVWEGNEVTLPAYSQIEELDVQVPSTIPEQLITYLTSAAFLSVFALALAVMLLRRRTHGTESAPG